MTDATRALVRLSAAIGAGAELSGALAEAAAHADARAVEETILQSYLFAGYPKALQAMGAWRRQSGVAAPAAASDDRPTWRSRGEAVCRVVYGGQYERLRSNVASLHPDLEQWMLEEGYGKVLAREGLELAVRELCIVALLAVQKAPAQLHSHLRGALHAGADAADAEEALDIAAQASGGAEATLAAEVWQRVRARGEDGER